MQVFPQNLQCLLLSQPWWIIHCPTWSPRIWPFKISQSMKLAEQTNCFPDWTIPLPLPPAWPPQHPGQMAASRVPHRCPAVAGGSDGSRRTATTEILNVRENKWVFGRNLMDAKCGSAAVSVSKEMIDPEVLKKLNDLCNNWVTIYWFDSYEILRILKRPLF